MNDDILAKLIREFFDKIIDDDDQDELYRDTPILTTASRLKRSAVPKKYREMRLIKGDYNKSYSFHEEKVSCFYKQAVFMENFEDDYEYGLNVIKHMFPYKYYPCYDDLSDIQLRAYFTWRTKIRRGEVSELPFVFVSLYFYELINLIGVSTPMEALDRMNDIHTLCKKQNNAGSAQGIILYDQTRWIYDFIIYYNLPSDMLPKLQTENENFEKYLIAANYGKYDDDKLFDALSALSSYNILKSKFYRSYPDDVKRVVCIVYREMSEKAKKEKRKKSYFEKLFGDFYEEYYYIFRNALFYNQDKSDREYETDEFEKYICSNGEWYHKIFFFNSRATQAGAFMKTIDRIMRQRYNFPYPLKSDGKSRKVLERKINEAIDSLENRKKQEAFDKIEIDVSKLQDIRSAADETREKLLTDEERDFEDGVREEIREKQEETEGKESSDNPYNLTEDEWGFLMCLAENGDINDFAHGKKIMVSVTADSINEKLFDEFGDNVIDFGADKPEIIEDYREEIQQMINNLRI